MSTSLRMMVGKGVAWSAASSVLVKAISLTTTIFMLTHLSLYEYGVVELVLSILPSLSIFLLPGFSALVIADMGVARSAGDERGAKKLFLEYLGLQTLLASIAFCIVFLGSSFIASYYGAGTAALFQAVAFLFLMSPLRSGLITLFSYSLQFSLQSTIGLLEEVLKLCAIVLAILAFQVGGIHAVVFSAVFAQMFAILFFIPFGIQSYRTYFPKGRAGTIAIFALVTAHGKWNILLHYVNNIGTAARLWFIKFFLGTEAVGIFAVAQGMFGHVMGLVPIEKVISYILPSYTNDPVRTRALIAKGIKYQCAASLVIGSIFAIGIVPLVHLFFPHYAPSIPVFLLLLFALVPSSFKLVTHLFYLFKEQKNLFHAVLLRTGGTIVLLPLLLPLFGIYGAALEFVFTTALSMYERYRTTRRMWKSRVFVLRDILSFDTIDREILVACLARIKLPFLSK